MTVKRTRREPLETYLEKIGPAAYKKKADRRKPHYVGSWTVIFKCHCAVHVSLAGSSDINTLAVSLHNEAPMPCRLKDCRPVKFIPGVARAISED